MTTVQQQFKNVQESLEAKDKASEFANVPVGLADVIDPDIKGERKAPTIDDILDGNTKMIGNEQLSPKLLNDAMNGDTNSIDTIIGKINTYNQKLKQRPPISGVVVESTGQLKMGPPPEGLTDTQKSDYKDYQQNRLRIYNTLKGARREDGSRLFPDDKVINLLTKYYSTGEFFRESYRQLAEIPRALSQLPTLVSMGYNAVASGVDAIGDSTYADEWAKRKPRMAYNNALLKNLYNKFGLNTTFAESLDKSISDKFVKDEGQSVYDSSYTGKSPSGQKINYRVIDEEQGKYLLDYGFGELPYYEQFGERLFENALFSVPFARLGLMKGAKDYKFVKELRKNKPKEYTPDMTDIEVLRTYKLNQKTSRFGKAWTNWTNSMGRTFNMQGNVGSYTGNLEYNAALKANLKAVEAKQKQFNTAFNKKSTTKPQLDAIRGELQNLKTVRGQLLLKSLGTGDRFTASVLGAELPIAFYQSTAGYFHNQLGVSRDTAELLGIVTGVTGGPQWLLRKAANLGGTVTNALLGPVNKIFYDSAKLFEDAISLPFDITNAVLEKRLGKPFSAGLRGLLVDRRFDDLSKVLGRPLKSSEVASFNNLARIMKDMPIEQRENVFKAIDDYKNTRSKILKMFDEGAERDEAAEIFSLTFAHASGLAPLMAIDRLSATKINPNNPDWKNLAEQQLEAENVGSIAELGISKLIKMIQKKEKINPRDRSFGLAFSKGMQEAVDGHKLKMAERRQGLLNLMRDYVENQISNPNVPVPEDLVTKIHEHNLMMRPELMADAQTSQRALQDTVGKIRKSLNERYKLIESYRSGADKSFQMGRLVEDMYDAHIESNYLLGKSFYKKAEDIAAKSDPVDVSPIVEKLVMQTQDLKKSDLGYFFSTKGRFFGGRVGKMTLRAFDSMAEKALERAGFGKQELEELRGYFGVATDPLDAALGPNASTMEIALHLKNVGFESQGKRQKININPFQASPFELEEMRKFFVGLENKSRDEAMKKLYGGFIKRIDDSYKTNPELNKAIQEARDDYRDLMFDPTRAGSIGERIENARIGPERVVTKRGDESRYKFTYLEGMRPEEWHKDIADAIDAVTKGERNASSNLRKKIDELEYYWGDRGPTGEVVFNITTAEGKAKLENLQNLLKMQFYEHWGSMRENLVNQIAKGLNKDNVYDPLTAPVTPSLTFNNVEKLKRLQEDNAFKVTILEKTKDGVERKRTVDLLDVEDIIAADNDITNLLELSKTAREQYNKLAKDLNNAQSDVMKNAQDIANLRKNGTRELEKISEIKDPAQFFETVISQGTYKDVADMKSKFLLGKIEMHKAEGGLTDSKTLKEVELKAELEFKEGMIYYITQGLLDRAGMSKSTVKRLKTLDGTVMPHTEMTKAAQFFTDIKNDKNQEIFQMFFDDKHIEYMEDIADFLQIASGTSNVKYNAEGIIRNISPNELISRAFNLARGMVGLPYVGAELGIRLAASKNIELLGLALRNKDAALIMGKLLEDPKTVSLDEVRTFGTLVKAHIANELVTKGVPNINAEYLPQEEMRRYERLTSMELMDNPPDDHSFVDGILTNIYKSFTGEQSETVQ